MSNHTFTTDNGTPRSSHLSSSATLSLAWSPPKAPLPPHRLAKLANALGVSTPMPAFHHNSSFMSRSTLDTPGPLDTLRRSPTPSTVASMSSHASSVSKFSKHLLHVIPPLYLPHESEEESYVTPPPATASGYHTQFRRGTLVPVHSTLQAQLAAIAKEYALPSTAGMILYLVSSAKVSSQSSTSYMGLEDDDRDEPGPRLSEDIWKHLWTRVMKAEQRDDFLPLPSRSHTPNIFSLSNGVRSTPFLLQDGQPLRPFLSGSDPVHPHPLQPPFTPSPSTPSTISDLRSHSKSAPPSSSSVSQSDPDTPDTSTGSHSFARDPAARKHSIDLPGLDSPSIIPILAKVEFDIDRRKAAWYDPWLRSRRMNHVKRTESRAGRKCSVNEGEEDTQNRYAPISFVTGDKEASNLMLSKGASLLRQPTPMSTGYEPLRETGDDVELSEEGDANVGDFPAPIAMQNSPGRSSKRKANPNIVPLALNAVDLTALPNTSESEFEHLGKEEDEVQDLLDQMSHHQPSITDPLSPRKRSSSPTGARKHVPPPLVIVPNPSVKDLTVPSEPSPMPGSAESAHLAYLYGSYGELSAGGSAEGEDDDYVPFARMRSPEEHEKREGVVFDDLDLGLDPTEDFDDGDPNDRRRSQFLMKAQLDEIERTMAQLSPRILHTDLAERQNNTSRTPSPSNSHTLSPGKWNGTYSPRYPRQPEMVDNSDSSESKGQTAWPAVPFSSLNESPSSSRSRPDAPPSPPKLAVNGVTTSAPTSFVAKPRSSASEMSVETQMRKRALEEEQGQGYLGYASSTIVDDSPIIPLSPDPFGRFSSSPSGRSSAYWEADPSVQSSSSTLSSVAQDTHNRTRSTSSAATSRFSVDSVATEEMVPKANNRSTFTIKRLWRKSGKNVPSPNTPPPPPPPPPVGRRTSVQIPQRPERPSQEKLELPPSTPTTSKVSPQLGSPYLLKELPPSPQPHQLSFPQHVQTQQLPLHPSPQQTPFHPQSHQSPVPQPHPQPHQLSVPHPQQLGVPQPQPRSGPYGMRAAHTGPIVAAQMQPNRGNASADRLHFDQETPYPIRRMPPSPQPNPPPNLPSSSPRFSDLPLASTPPPAIPPSSAHLSEKERPSARKSILKGWKSATSSTMQPSPMTESRSSTEKQNMERQSMERPPVERSNANGATRSRRPSILNLGSSRTSPVSPSPDIPPSPQIPQQYINPQWNEHRQSMKSKLSSGSVDLSGPNSSLNNNNASGVRSSSPTRSRRSSLSSRPSFDASQFEIVSPKMNSTLSYPYHELDRN